MKRARKLLKEKALQELEKEARDLEADDTDSQVKTSTAFAFEDQDSGQEQSQRRVEAGREGDREGDRPTASKRKNKKKRQKEKQRKEQQQKRRMEEQKLRESNQLKQFVDKLNSQSKTEETIERAVEKEEEKGIFMLSVDRLNYHKEFERMFPEAKVSQAKDKKEKKVRGARPGALKQYKLVPIRGERISGEGIQFVYDQVQERKEFVYGRFKGSKGYLARQQRFLQVSRTGDINLIFDFLRFNPTHVDALFVAAEFFGLQGNFTEANAMFQSILRIFEEAAPTLTSAFFNQRKALTILHHEDELAQIFLKTLSKQIDACIRKGTVRAALQYNKLLLRVNLLQDPCGALLQLDFNFYSARAYQQMQQFMQDFGKSVSPSGSVRLIPNFLLTTALAKFRTFTQMDEEDTLIREVDLTQLLEFSPKHIQEALTLQKVAPLEDQLPNVTLLRALCLYPSILAPLLKSNELMSKSISHSVLTGWQKKSFAQICQHQFFNSMKVRRMAFMRIEDEEDQEGLNKVLQIYLERNKGLWKDMQVALWVKAGAGFVLNQIQLVHHLLAVAGAGEETEGLSLPFRLSRYCGLTKSMFSDRVDRIDFQNLLEQGHRREQAGRALNMDQGWLGLFMQSLLPWVNIGQNQEQQDQ